MQSTGCKQVHAQNGKTKQKSSVYFEQFLKNERVKSGFHMIPHDHPIAEKCLYIIADAHWQHFQRSGDHERPWKLGLNERDAQKDVRNVALPKCCHLQLLESVGLSGCSIVVDTKTLYEVEPELLAHIEGQSEHSSLYFG